MKRTVIFVALCVTSGAALANMAPPPLPTDEIAADLGVSKQAFQTCFTPQQQPDPRSRPDPSQLEAEQAQLLSCLQGENAKLTLETLNEVMDNYRPKGPAPRR